MIAYTSIMVRTNAIPNATSQPRGVLPASTSAAILSVTVAYVCPGSMIGGRAPGPACPAASATSRLPLLRRRFRARVADSSQIARARPRVQIRQHAVVERGFFQLRHALLRVVDVPKHDGRCRARLLTRRHDLSGPDRAIF